MSNKFLYKCFDKWVGSIYIIADTHFGEIEIEKSRGISAEALIKNINRKVTKNDTLVLLGDVGDIEYVKKLKAGYKVLVLGNHDKGASNYQRRIINHYLINGEIIPEHDDNPDLQDLADIHGDITWCGGNVLKIKHEKGFIYEQWYYFADGSVGGTYKEDTKLFDETYEGVLMINEKILLSHEPVDFMYAFNIHGHDHNGSDFKKYVLKSYAADMPKEDMSENYLRAIRAANLKKLNVCADWIGYSPVSLKSIINSGVLKDVTDIHRVTIDKATDKSKRRE